MKTKRILSIDQARRIAIGSQRLQAVLPEGGKEAAARAIEHLGYVQIDTISVVARAHHHTLWNRCPDYRPSFLHDLVAVDRRVFEYWAHAIAFLPMSDYRFYIPRMQRHRTGARAWLSEWKRKNGHVLEDVMGRIRTEGALTSKDFVPPPGTKRGTWWDWKPAKRALEILFWQGHLMISERRNFQKVYDLTERVLPPETDTRIPTQEELGIFHVRRALGAMGLAQEKEIGDAFHIVDRATLAAALEALEQDTEVVRISVVGVDGDYYALPEALKQADAPVSEVASILSPFDNLTIQRARMEKLFGFQYTIECYVPPAKRKYGYFVLPVLWRDRLIARLDAKAQRKEATLWIKALWFEPSFSAFEDALPAIADALASYARFNGCTQIQIDKIVPTGHKRALRSLIKQSLTRNEDSA